MGPRRGGEDEGGALRAVVDTSTLVGHARRRDLQEAAALGPFEAIWSPWTVAELSRVLTCRAIERGGGDPSAAHHKTLSASSKAMMEYLTATFAVVDPKPPHPIRGMTWPIPGMSPSGRRPKPAGQRTSCRRTPTSIRPANPAAAMPTRASSTWAATPSCDSSPAR